MPSTHAGRVAGRCWVILLSALVMAVLAAGAPTARAAGGGQLSVSGDVPAQLAPGAPAVSIPVRLTNLSDGLVTLTGLTTALRLADLPDGCRSEWFHIVQSDVSPSTPVDVAAGAAITLPVQGASAPTIQLIETHTDQDACQRARLTLDYTAVTRAGSAQPQTPQLLWSPPDAVSYGTPLTALQLDPTSSVPGHFDLVPPLGSVLTAGTHTLSATFQPTDPSAYRPATVTTTLLVTPAVPSLQWAVPGPIAYGTPLSRTQLDATASTPGRFTYDPPEGQLLPAGHRTLSVTFTPADPQDYRPSNAAVALTVDKAAPVITWANPAAVPVGVPLSADQLDATASVPGSFRYDPPAGSVLEAGATTLSVLFTPTDSADYATASARVTVHTSGPPPSPAGRLLAIEIDGRPGIKVVDGRVHVVGHGLRPGSAASIYARSTPQLLATVSADARGDLATTVRLPAGLGPGGHHVEVRGTSAAGVPILESAAFTVAEGDRLGSIGRIPRGALATLVPFEPAEHEALVLRATAGGVALLGALGAAIGGAGGRRSAGVGGEVGSGEGKRGEKGGGSDGAFLADVELERELVHRHGLGRGDRSRSWRWPGTRHIDRLSVELPARLAALSPAIARVSVDGDYLRAMFGGLAVLAYPLAVGMGIAASHSNHQAAIPPTFWWFAAILALSIFDSMAGYAAGLSFSASVLIDGGVTGASSIRELSGIVLVWFSVPLAAGAVRPLRRHVRLHPDSVWDRLADFVIAGLFAGWLTAEMVELLSPLAGFEVPLAEHKWTMALITITVVGTRIVLETVATHHYPDRLRALRHRGSLEDTSRAQMVLSFAVQISVYIFIATAYMRFDWPLYAGTALFYLPLVPWLFADKLPKSAFVAKWMPAGVTTWTFVIVSGVLLSRLLEHAVTNPMLAEKVGFIVEPIPILIIWGLELFAAEDDEEEAHEEEEASGGGRFPMTWALRLAGVPAVALCTYLVVAGIAGG